MSKIEINPDYAIRPMNSSYSASDAVLDVSGSHAFTVRNTGTVRAFIYETVEIWPGQQIPFENIMGLPFAENAPLSFDSAAGTKKLEVIKFILVENPHKTC